MVVLTTKKTHPTHRWRDVQQRGGNLAVLSLCCFSAAGLGAGLVEMPGLFSLSCGLQLARPLLTAMCFDFLETQLYARLKLYFISRR